MQWLEWRGFFDPADVGFSADRVHFGETRATKAQLVRELGCTHFMDDLPETFLEPGFPAGVIRILFDGVEAEARLANASVMDDWSRLEAFVFDVRA